MGKNIAFFDQKMGVYERNLWPQKCLKPLKDFLKFTFGHA